MKNYRRIAERFGDIDAGGSLDQLVKLLRREVERFPEDAQDAVEAVLVERIENDLRDVFGLEQDLEAALAEEDES